MIIKYELFENVDFYDDFFKKNIKDVDYYLNKIEELDLLHWFWYQPD